MNLNFTLLAQAITFFIFVWFTAKFVWPPLMRAVEARQQEIADGLAAGEQGRRSLETSTKQAQQEIAAARARAAEIIAQAEKRGAQMVEEAKVAAREETGREKAAAKAEIEQQASLAKEALRAQVAKLAVAGAERILRREVDAKAHSDLLRAVEAEL